jgi:hypothetical protein
MRVVRSVGERREALVEMAKNHGYDHHLADFGFATDEATQRVQIRLVDNLAGTRSADPTGFGALNSAPAPEPSRGFLLSLGLLALTLARRSPSIEATVLRAGRSCLLDSTSRASARVPTRLVWAYALQDRTLVSPSIP